MRLPGESGGRRELRPALSTGWGLRLYPDAAEAGARWYGASDERGRSRWVGEEPDPLRSEVEAARRARGQLRRYCAAGRLNRFASLTYRGEGCHDPLALRQDLAQFFRTLRRSLGEKAFPYAWVPEWHKTGHGLHAHFAVGKYVPRRVIEESWGRGFVHIKLIGDLPVGSGSLEEARCAARYLAKYACKAFDEKRLSGLHRYDVGQGFQPRAETLFGRKLDEVVELANMRMGSEPSYRWTSDRVSDWKGPPAAWVSWGS